MKLHRQHVRRQERRTERQKGEAAQAIRMSAYYESHKEVGHTGAEEGPVFGEEGGY